MPKFHPAPSHKEVHSSREHMPCAEEVTDKADRGQVGECSLISLGQIGAETEVEFAF